MVRLRVPYLNHYHSFTWACELKLNSWSWHFSFSVLIRGSRKIFDVSACIGWWNPHCTIFLVQCSEPWFPHPETERGSVTARLSYFSFNIGGRRENLTICVFFLFFFLSLGETLKWYKTSNAWTCIFKSRPEIAMNVESFPSVLEMPFVFERAFKKKKKIRLWKGC